MPPPPPGGKCHKCPCPMWQFNAVAQRLDCWRCGHWDIDHDPAQPQAAATGSLEPQTPVVSEAAPPIPASVNSTVVTTVGVAEPAIVPHPTSTDAQKSAINAMFAAAGVPKPSFVKSAAVDKDFAAQARQETMNGYRPGLVAQKKHQTKSLAQPDTTQPVEQVILIPYGLESADLDVNGRRIYHSVKVPFPQDQAIADMVRDGLAYKPQPGPALYDTAWTSAQVTEWIEQTCFPRAIPFLRSMVTSGAQQPIWRVCGMNKNGKNLVPYSDDAPTGKLLQRALHTNKKTHVTTLYLVTANFVPEIYRGNWETPFEPVNENDTQAADDAQAGDNDAAALSTLSESMDNAASDSVDEVPEQHRGVKRKSASLSKSGEGSSKRGRTVSSASSASYPGSPSSVDSRLPGTDAVKRPERTATSEAKLLRAGKFLKGLLSAYNTPSSP